MRCIIYYYNIVIIIIHESAEMKLSATKRIASIQFSALSAEDIERCSSAQVSRQDLVDLSQDKHTPASDGCLDPRLGVSDKKAVCGTCKKGLTDCPGHFGYIRLELPVFHPGFFKHAVGILQSVCKRCSRCLLSEPVIFSSISEILCSSPDLFFPSRTMRHS